LLEPAVKFPRIKMLHGIAAVIKESSSEVSGGTDSP
jgi:hypothetical protein